MQKPCPTTWCPYCYRVSGGHYSVLPRRSCLGKVQLQLQWKLALQLLARLEELLQQLLIKLRQQLQQQKDLSVY